MRVLIVLFAVALCLLAASVSAEQRALEPVTPASNAAQIAALQKQIAELKAQQPKKPYYNVRQADVTPSGAKRTSGQFAKKPVAPPAPPAPVISPWSAQIMAAKRGDEKALSLGPKGPYTEGEKAYVGAASSGPSGWCGTLVNGWVAFGKCGYDNVCRAGTLNTKHGGRTYSCTKGDSYNKGPADGNPDPPTNLPNYVAPPVEKPKYVDRCGNRCYGNQCCKSSGPGGSDYFQCMNC